MLVLRGLFLIGRDRVFLRVVSLGVGIWRVLVWDLVYRGVVSHLLEGVRLGLSLGLRIEESCPIYWRVFGWDLVWDLVWDSGFVFIVGFGTYGRAGTCADIVPLLPESRRSSAVVYR